MTMTFTTITAVQNDPPELAEARGLYLVGDTPTGAWAGKKGQIATAFQGKIWLFKVPDAGMVVTDGQGLRREYDGTDWVDDQLDVIEDLDAARAATRDVAVKVNEILDALRTAGLLATSPLEKPRTPR